jgi:hypothetical protein
VRAAASTCPALPPRRRRSKGTGSKGSWSAAFSGSPAVGRSRLLLLVPLTTLPGSASPDQDRSWSRYSFSSSLLLFPSHSRGFVALCCAAPRGLVSLSLFLLSLRVTRSDLGRWAPHFRGRFCCCVFPAFVLCFPSSVTVH